MLRFQAAAAVLSLIAGFLVSVRPATAKPYPREIDLGANNDTSVEIEKRCGNMCGWNKQLCCAANEYCYTDVQSRAQCGYGTTTAAVAGGYWQYYTSTFLETDTEVVTSTVIYSSFIGVATVQATTTAWQPQATATASCNCPCGAICCASDQYCLTPGQCAQYGGQSSVVYYSTVLPTSTYAQSTYSAPLRPTSSALVVITATASATTTVPFVAPVATGANVTLTATQAQSSGGLSGGAIAGIVIGAILGIFLLILLILCLCFKAVFDGVAALFGFGKDRRRRTREEEINQRRRQDGGNRRWVGNDRPGRVDRPPPRKDGGGGGLGGLAAIGLGLGGLAAALGLKRASDRRKDEKSEYTGSSYYDSSYYTGSTESDRRRQDERRSRR